MRIENVGEFVKKIENLPTLPQFYQKFIEKINDPKASANDLAKIISADQSITSRILRVANSSFYGFRQRITNIPHAIVIIGFNGIHHLVLNMPVLSLFKGENINPNFNVSEIWEHSLGTAAIAKVIARKIKYKKIEEVFTAGLLHDIGKVIIYKYLPEEFNLIIEKAKTECLSIKEAEDEILGVNHTQIGEALLKHWDFPESLVLTTAHHHNPILAKESMEAACIIHLADIVCKIMEIGSGGDNIIFAVSDEVWGKLGLREESLEEIIKESQQEVSLSNIFSELIKS